VPGAESVADLWQNPVHPNFCLPASQTSQRQKSGPNVFRPRSS